MDTQPLLLITLVIAIVATALIWLARQRLPVQQPSANSVDDLQEVTILVRNGYHPDTIRVRAGRPLRLVFQRAEDDPCSSRVYLSEPPLNRYLPPFAATAIAFTPNQVGSHLFTCEEGRHRGRLIVEPNNRPGLPAASLAAPFRRLRRARRTSFPSRAPLASTPTAL